jgi:MOSC domain-containing protein
LVIKDIWRYPVKSMAGEKLDRVILTPLGIPGDRVVHVEDDAGRFITSRTHPRLLGHHAMLDPAGEPRIDNLLWSAPESERKVADIVGPGARLVRDDSADRFDVLPLLVATDGAIAAFGHDGRRLRPNIVVGGVEGLAERLWEGQCLRVGQAIIGVDDLRDRCVMTTYDPDTQRQDLNVLREIVNKFDGKLALNCSVIRGGEIRVGDTIELDDCEHRSSGITDSRLAR